MAWVQYSMVAHLTCSILSRNALRPASLDVKLMRSCPKKFSNNAPEMLVAAIVNVRLAAVSHVLRSCTPQSGWRGQIAAVPHVLSMLHVGSMTAAQYTGRTQRQTRDTFPASWPLRIW